MLLAHALFENGEEGSRHQGSERIHCGASHGCKCAETAGEIDGDSSDEDHDGKNDCGERHSRREETADMATDVSAFTIVPNWLPPDIDEKISSVEAENVLAG